MCVFLVEFHVDGGDDSCLAPADFCRAVFLQRRSRELLDNDELQVCVMFSWCIV